ncbi:hypothetical protein ACFY9S_39425 [Streptomyces sp. NPDC012474]|uniref:hypothetical protein n=1 Tax=Streptomyces sp. NPDC012474 TaxID=3364836 RepID=UPI0036F0096E
MTATHNPAPHPLPRHPHHEPVDAHPLPPHRPITPLFKAFGTSVLTKSGVFDSITKQYGNSTGSLFLAKSGVYDSVLKQYGRGIGALSFLEPQRSISLGVLDSVKLGSLLDESFFGSYKTATLGLDAFRGSGSVGSWEADPFGWGKGPVTTGIYDGVLKAAVLDQLSGSVFPAARGAAASVRLPGLLDSFTAPLAPSLPRRAEELADLLLPPNLQDFSSSEWSQLIDITTDAGIGLMRAPSAGHLRALLGEDSREGRYAYLLQHQDELLDELSAGMQEVTEEPLQDLVRLGMRAIECARAGLWEGALALATNVLYSAMEEHGIEWYRQEFRSVRDHNNQPIRGINGPGATVEFVLSNAPMPERRVGIFDLRTHLVTRPMSHVFKNSALVQDQHNRHAVCHEASYTSLREVYVLPAMLNMHALLRVLDEKMSEDSPSP